MTQWLAQVGEAFRAATLSTFGASGEVIFLIIVAIAVFLMFALYAMSAGLLERKLIGRVHSRIGPMYTGPGGVLQTVADALKLLRKEIIYPVGSDRAVFTLAPVIMFLTAYMSVLFVPLGSFIIIDSQYSLLIVLALLSLSPVAVLVGSWASNSKYSTLGGLRSAAMTMAYEVLLAVAIASIILTTHSFSIIEIVRWQADAGVWLVFVQPFAFALFIIAAVASVERNPMDLTEAESELVSGWKTEYGGAYFSITLLAEYVKLLITVILISSLFFGGWADFAGEIGFAVKVFIFTALMIYIRATAMRLRIDQLLHDLWTRLIPLAFLNFIVTFGVLAALGGA
jgi:NADH-quinone oxidoreductase subunit H